MDARNRLDRRGRSSPAARRRNVSPPWGARAGAIAALAASTVAVVALASGRLNDALILLGVIAVTCAVVIPRLVGVAKSVLDLEVSRNALAKSTVDLRVSEAQERIAAFNERKASAEAQAAELALEQAQLESNGHLSTH